MTEVEVADQQDAEEILPDQIFIGTMGRILGRYEHTVRRWVKEAEAIFDIVGEVPQGRGFLPHDLWPERESEGRRRLFWRPDQVDGLREFVHVKELRKGWGGSKRA